MNSMKKNFIWNIIGTTINAFNSLFLMIVVTRINDVFDAGVFTFAFSVATLFNVIGVYAGRIYQVTDNGEFNDKDYLFNRIISCTLMLIISVLFITIKNYSFTKQLIIFGLCFLKMLEAFAEVLYAYFQKQGNLYKVGVSLTVKSILGLFTFIITDLMTKNLILSIIMFILIYVFVMIFYDFRNIEFNKIKSLSTNKNRVLLIFVKGFATFIVTFLTIYIINASKYAIDDFSSEKIQAIFGIIIMPATIMILVAQYIVHPFLVKITDEINNKNYKNVNNIVIKICLTICLIGFLSILAGCTIGIPILEFIYNIPLKEYTFCLAIILMGATFYACTSIINTVLIAARHTVVQMVIYIIMALFTLVMAGMLVSKYEILGASLNYLLTMFLCLIIFIITYLFIIKESNEEVKHTFVVLAYKESPFLEDCLKSVLNQSVKTEVVIATTTKNKHITDLAKKYNLNVIEGEHTSIGGDFDFALNAVDSDLVTIAHQDDIYDFNYAEKMLKNYYLYKDSMIIFPDYYEIRNEKKVYTNTNLKIKRILLSSLWIKQLSGIRLLKRNALKFGNSISCPAVTFVKKNVPKKVFTCDLKCNIDWFAWERLSKRKGKFIFVKQKLMGHRIDDTTTTTDIINEGIRTKEDLVILKKFWPDFIAKNLNKLYKNSEKSNNL